MGLNPEDVIAQAGADDKVNVTVTSNEEDGICLWAQGALRFTPAAITPSVHATFPTLSGQLTSLISDRRLNVASDTEFGRFQPFRIDAGEPLHATIMITSGAGAFVDLTLFGNTVTLAMHRHGKMLAGIGPSLGPSEGGLFVISFQSVTRSPVIN